MPFPSAIWKKEDRCFLFLVVNTAGQLQFRFRCQGQNAPVIQLESNSPVFKGHEDVPLVKRRPALRPIAIEHILVHDDDIPLHLLGDTHGSAPPGAVDIFHDQTFRQNRCRQCRKNAHEGIESAGSDISATVIVFNCVIIGFLLVLLTYPVSVCSARLIGILYSGLWRLPIEPVKKLPTIRYRQPSVYIHSH